MQELSELLLETKAKRALEKTKPPTKGTYTAALVIPAYNENEGITRLLRKLQDSHSAGFFDELLVVLVIRDTEDNTTFMQAEKYISDQSLENVILLNEDDYEGRSCIGHARALGFYYVLYHLSCLTNTPAPELQTVLISADADMRSMTPDIYKRISQKLLIGPYKLLSYSNFLPESSWQKLIVRELKIFEDCFFRTGFDSFSCINGRAYALSPDLYISSGGVDSTRTLDDIEFGIRCNAHITEGQRLWFKGVYVSNSPRRFDAIYEGADMFLTYVAGDYRHGDSKSYDTVYENKEAILNANLKQWIYMLLTRNFHANPQVTFPYVLSGVEVLLNRIDSFSECVEITDFDVKVLKQSYDRIKKEGIEGIEYNPDMIALNCKLNDACLKDEYTASDRTY